MDNERVAAVLSEIGVLLELQGENPFKVRAYQNAARAIEGLAERIDDLAREDRLQEIPGIGEAIAKKVATLATTGDLPYHRELRETVPPGIFDVLRVRGLGPKKAKRLWKELGVLDLRSLRKACRDDRVKDLAGFGEKSQRMILEGIAFLEKAADRSLLGEALPLARELVAALTECPAVQRASLAGSIRRGKETIGDLDLVASSDDPEGVMEFFTGIVPDAETIARGRTKTSIRLESGIQADLRVVGGSEFPACLAYFTGSKEHNVRVRTLAASLGFKVNEYGVFREGSEKPEDIPDEEALYRALGLAYVPPELREDRGEIEAAREGKLPVLVEERDVKGVLHCHSIWSDGRASIHEMALAAKALGMKYLGIADHSKAAHYAGGLDEKKLVLQAAEIDAVEKRVKGLRILRGSEVDILADGSLDFADEVLAGLDFVVASVHSKFGMSEDEMTARIVRAIENPFVDCLAHPTGRLLLAREGYRVNLEKVIEAAARTWTFLEINGNPRRLDLDAVWARRAAQAEVKILLGPDAHDTEGLADTEYALLTARRAWLTKDDVANSLPVTRLLASLRRRRNPEAKRARKPRKRG
ncbi:MAG: DNA polymerase/3'-5' exonuclease PolX [Planctomycetes bacterium]|nr:DNA polymerase/3'-5' exonuclease PolX [Planctomycetota bacterium]